MASRRKRQSSETGDKVLTSINGDPFPGKTHLIVMFHMT